jgi:hypothetical protein
MIVENRYSLSDMPRSTGRRGIDETTQHEAHIDGEQGPIGCGEAI